LGKVLNYLSISFFLTKNASKQVSELRRFSIAQKEWFVLAAFSMTNSDKMRFDEEFTVSTAFLKVMGISSKEAFRIVSK